MEDPQVGHGLPVALAPFTPVTFSTCRASDSKGRLNDLNNGAQPSGWSQEVLTMRSASGDALTRTALNPLVVSMGSPKAAQPRPTAACATPHAHGTCQLKEKATEVTQTGTLTVIACGAPGSCVASGPNGSFTLANGTWSLVTSAGDRLVAISCPTTVFCVGVRGSSAVTWTPSGWASQVKVPLQSPSTANFAV